MRFYPLMVKQRISNQFSLNFWLYRVDLLVLEVYFNQTSEPSICPKFTAPLMEACPNPSGPFKGPGLTLKVSGSKLPVQKLLARSLADPDNSVAICPYGKKLFHIVAVTNRGTERQKDKKTQILGPLHPIGIFFFIFLCMGGWETSIPAIFLPFHCVNGNSNWKLLNNFVFLTETGGSETIPLKKFFKDISKNIRNEQSTPDLRFSKLYSNKVSNFPHFRPMRNN